ncbi:SNF2 domain-containing protein CLASSY 4-like [Rosa sericea]
MDYRPISSRTRSKTEIALTKRYWEMKINSGVSPARSKKMRRYNQASVPHMSESSSSKQSFEWVADHVEQNDDDSEGFYSQESKRSGKQGKGEGVAVGVKRKRSLGLDVSADGNKDACNWRAVSDNGVEVVDLVDSDDDDEVVVSKGKEGGGGVDVDVVSDGESNEDVDDVSGNESDEDVSSVKDSSDESEFLPGKESAVEENDKECVSSSDEDSSEEGNEEECELTEKNEKESKGESVEVGLERNRNADGDDLHSSYGHDFDDSSKKVSKGETVEVGLEGKISDDGDDLHSCSAHDTDVRSEQVWKEESLGILPKGKINADGVDLHSCFGHDIDDRSAKVGEAESVLPEDRTGCDRTDDNNDGNMWKEESVGVGSKENRSGDGYNLNSSSVHDINHRIEKLGEAESVLAEERTGCDRSDDNNDGKVWKEESVGVGSKENRSGDECNLHSSSVHDINDRSEKLGKAGGVSAERKDGWDKRREYGSEGKTGFGYSRNENNGKLKAESETGSASRLKDDTKYKGKTGTVGRKTWSGKWNEVHNECKKSEGDSFLSKQKSTRAPKQKRLPTVAFEAPKVESLPLRFSFSKQPTIPEKPDYEREVDELFDEYKFAMAYDENASTESKAKGNDDAKSKNRIPDFDDEAHGGTSESGFDKGSKLDVQTACKTVVEAEGNNFSESTNSRKEDNDETHGGSCPEPYKKKERVRELTNEKGITAPKDCNAFMILVDSIHDKGEVSGEQLPPSNDESPQDEAPRDEPLPKFFRLGHPPSPAPEKSASEIELEKLFEEYDFVQMYEGIGSTDSIVVETNDSIPPGKEVTQHMLCSQGKHDLILDEEIGYICRFCPHVHQEIKYIVPDFASNPYGKAGKRFYEEDNRSILDDLQCNDPDDSGFSSHAHTEGTVWDLIPGVESDMYPHQREGFEFIWRHLAGGIQLGKLEKPTAYGGDGCIISHAPGTGKTRLTIIFIQSYMNFNPSSRPLIVAPRTMLLTWEEEFKKWGFDIPFHNLNNPDFTGKEDEAARNLVKDGKSSEMTNLTRIVKLKSWAKKRSILGISYSLFEQVCGAPTKKGRYPLSSRRKFEVEQMSEILLKFPGLVVFDEGHNPRNDQSHSWNALLQLKTRRRIILSGTPFQNNFEELYNTVRLVRPEWTTNLTCLGAFDKKQWTSGQIRGREGRKSNAGRGQFADDNTKRAKEVRAMISPFVHVYKGTILQDKLPGLRNSVVVLQPTALQQRYSDRTRLIKNPFKYERIEAKVTIHPSLLLTEERSMFHEGDEYSGDWERLTEIKLNPECGVKARFAVDLIRLCQAMKERVLVFSQWVDPLFLIRDLLKSQFQWVEGEEVVYMDGKCDAKQRQSSMSYFNDPSSKAKAMLATTKGCNEGISLVGASRVVLLDVAWNPSVERQAISRAYRLGQKKIVCIYHLLMAGAREEDKYSRQVEKHRLSELVFSCSNTEADAKKLPSAVAEDKVLEEMVQHEKLKHIFHKITLLDEASYLDEDFM